MTTERAGDEGGNTPRAPGSAGARTRGSAGREHELQADRARAGAAGPQPAARSSQARGTVVATAVVAVAGFLAVLTVLALQLRSNPASVGLAAQKPRIVILRRIYQTTVHERVIGAGGGAVATTVHSSSAGVAPAPAPASSPVSTHTS